MPVSYEYANWSITQWSRNLWDILQEGKEQPEPWPNNRAYPVYLTPAQEKSEESYTKTLLFFSKCGLGSIGDLSRADGENIAELSLKDKFLYAVILAPITAWGNKIHGIRMQPRFDILHECLRDVIALHGIDTALNDYPPHPCRSETADALERLAMKTTVTLEKSVPQMIRSLPYYRPETQMPDNFRIIDL